MVNNETLSGDRSDNLTTASRIVGAYVALTIASVVILAVLAAAGSAQATSEAWGHAVIVLVFSVLLPLRLRAARRGSEGASRAVTIIGTVLLVVNLVEAVLPHAFPSWMRVEMVLVVGLMAGLVTLMVRDRR